VPPARLDRSDRELSEQLAAETQRLCLIPAPTFDEGRRAEYVLERLEAAGWSVRSDALGNVIATLGDEPPAALLAAHLDSVWDLSTELVVRRDGDRLCGPGIGDNACGLAALLRLADEFADAAASPLLLAATVGEEGLGDLRGMRALMDDPALNGVHRVVAVDGHLGVVVNQGVGSRRYRATYRGPGGHSWGDRGTPSPIDAVGRAIAAIYQISVPDEPRSSLNVGRVEGGTAVNAIAEQATLLLDLRSVDAATLADLDQRAVEQLRAAAAATGVKVDLELVGDRPAGSCPDGPLLDMARSALERHGIAPRLTASSTDANVPMSQGREAVSFGVYRGGGAHTLAEWLEVSSLAVGYKAFRDLARALATPPG
jgi:acetylornithine deacetylase/succinyl-diaminopimelate desuccinylase-like protein